VVEIVFRPAAVSGGGKPHPGGVHGVRELLWRGRSKNWLRPVTERVEDLDARRFWNVLNRAW
jgi:hypothetical protein